MDDYLTGMSALAAVAVLALLLWLTLRRGAQRKEALADQTRVDTLLTWPPESVRMLRTSERAAYNILSLALPGQMIFAQVPLARFIDVPKRNSYAEWMRRIGSHCVDFVICDASSKVVAVVDVRPSASAIGERLQRRLERVARTLQTVEIPLHVWIDAALPSVEAARDALAPIVGRHAQTPASPGPMPRPLSATLPPSRHPLTVSDDSQVEVIEMTDARASTWFDELDSEPPRQLSPSAQPGL